MRNKILISILALAVLGVIFYFYSDKSQPGPVPSDQEINFRQEGNVARNNPGFKPEVWYLFYEQPGAPALSKELNLDKVSVNLRNGQRVYIEGHKANNIVAVSKLQILNAVKDDLIWVDSPLPNTIVRSPLTVMGEARGNWYFEASFPVKLLDAQGKVLVQTPAQAQGDWMTTNYVPFTARLTFANPATDNGTLILEKDNPSGLPENADELRVPVKFKPEELFQP